MIFKQVREIIEGTKTQTRRIVKEGEDWKWQDEFVPHQTVATPSGRKKWRVGQEYAVVPGRAKPQVFYRYEGENELHLAHEHLMPHIDIDLNRQPTQLEFAKSWEDCNWKQYLLATEYKPLSIRITDIRQENLHDLTEADAIAEGIKSTQKETSYSSMVNRYFNYSTQTYFFGNPIKSYKSLWESINGKDSWDRNPRVWVLEFEAVQS